MRVSGVSTQSDGSTLVAVGKPDAYGSQFSHYLNGPVQVPVNGTGSCTNIFPALAKAGTGTISTGAQWGPRSGGWTIEEKTGGFIIIGQHASGVAIVNRFPMLAFTGKFDSNTNQGSTGTVSIYWQGTDTGQNMSNVYAISQDFLTTDEVNVSWMNERWEAYCRVAA